MSRFRKLIKIVYYFLVLLLIGVLYSSFSYFLLDYEMIDSFSQSDIGRMSVTILSAIVALVIIVKIIITILQKTDNKYLILKDEDGTIRLADTSIEKTVVNTLKEFDEVKEQRVRVKINNNSKGMSTVNVKIKCGLDEAMCKARGYFDDDSNEVQELESNQTLDIIEPTIKIDEEIIKENESNSHFENAAQIIADSEEDEIIDGLDIKSKEGIDNSVCEGKIDSGDYEENSDVIKPDFHDERTKVYEKMGIDEFCEMIQDRVHDSLKAFIGERVDKVNIKFYDIRVKDEDPKIDNKKRSSGLKKVKVFKKKKKRVN